MNIQNRHEIELVGIYNRCSTEEESQKNALQIQQAESREYVENMPGWKLVAQYVESKSGTTTDRPEYQRMLNDIRNNKVSIIVIKSIDRLNRNMRDFCNIISLMNEHNVRLYTYIDRRFADEANWIINSIQAMFSDNFSREQSKKIKNSHRRRQEKGTGLNITVPMFGWDKKEKDIYELNEQEAAFYRMAFDLADKGYGYRTISKKLFEAGARSKATGKRISEVQWRKMLLSPRAHGEMVAHKTEFNFATKKRYDIPEDEQVHWEGVLPPIVTKEYQERVIQKLKEHQKAEPNRPNKAGQYDFSGKLVCADCGSLYYRTVNMYSTGEQIDWKCSTFLSEGMIACANIKIDEPTLYELAEEACHKQFNNMYADNKGLIEETLKIIRETLGSNTLEKEQKALQKSLNKLKDNKSTLLQKLVDGVIGDKDYKEFAGELDEKIANIEGKLQDINTKLEEYNDSEARLSKIKEELQKGDIINKAKSQELINKIDKIMVYSDGTLEFRFDQVKLLGTDASQEVDEKLYIVKLQYNRICKSEKKRINEQDAIYDCIVSNNQILISEIMEKLNLSYYIVNNRINELKKAGKVKYIKGQRGGHWEVIEDQT